MKTPRYASKWRKFLSGGMSELGYEIACLLPTAVVCCSKWFISVEALRSKTFQQRSLSSILVESRFPTVPDLDLPSCGLRHVAGFHLYPLPCAQDFALQVEATTLLGIIGVEKSLEAFHDKVHVGLSTLRRLDVENLARLVQR